MLQIPPITIKVRLPCRNYFLISTAFQRPWTRAAEKKNRLRVVIFNRARPDKKPNGNNPFRLVIWDGDTPVPPVLTARYARLGRSSE